MALAPTTRTRLATQLDALAVILNASNRGLADVPPGDGGWSARENIAHLARHAEVFLDRLERLLTEDRPDLGAYRPEQDPEWPSWRALPLDDALERLRAARTRFIARVEALSDAQSRRVAIHPLLGEMDVGGWVELFLLHEAHHLYFLMRRLGQATRSLTG